MDYNRKLLRSWTIFIWISALPLTARLDLTIYLTSLSLDFLICQVGNKNNNLHGLLCGLNEIMQTLASGTALIQTTPLVGVRSSEIREKMCHHLLRSDTMYQLETKKHWKFT